MPQLNPVLPFAGLAAGLALLAIGVLKRRVLLLPGSFVALGVACLSAFVHDPSSGAFRIAGGLMLIFGVACIVLSCFCATLVTTRQSLRSIGIGLVTLGLVGMLIL